MIFKHGLCRCGIGESYVKVKQKERKIKWLKVKVVAWGLS